MPMLRKPRSMGQPMSGWCLRKPNYKSEKSLDAGSTNAHASKTTKHGAADFRMVRAEGLSGAAAVGGSWKGGAPVHPCVKWEIPISMNVQEQIKKYIASQPEPKRSNMQELHRLTVQVLPACKLWFYDGKDSKGRAVSNPNIGYGLHTIKYANGKSREFYQIGLSANTTGISVYILGLKDKKYLAKTYGKRLGKASVSGYCIKFKTLKDINIDVLEAAIRHGVEASNEKVS
jgi:hypothetical protein